MAITKRSELSLSHSAFSKLQSVLLLLQRGKHTSSGENVGPSSTKLEPKDKGAFDPSIWKTYDSRAVRIKNSAISKPAGTALSVLRGKGYEAYLVGGCVRDLLLNRVPKDFDIITTASLRQVKRLFNRCFIVGRRFPLGHVHLLGTIIEVSSFQKEGEEQSKGKNDISHKALKNCDEIDILRWENSIQRDFTINGLFFDPSKYKVYDYLNGMKDLRSSKVRAVIPAHLSFKEDCARILRGLRIASRLGFDLCEETAKAARELSYLVHNLEMTRLMLELNFMLSYGAARPSLQLLQKYRLLEIFLPFHAAYLNDQTKVGCDGMNTMLMKLFSNMDMLLAPDRPCDCTLWLGLLGFHIALIKRPEKPKLLQLFSALLYHGSWSKAMDSTKQTENKLLVTFCPEMRKSSVNEPASEKMSRKEIMDFALIIKESMKVFTSSDFVNGYLKRYYPNAPKFCGKIVISEKKRKNAQQLFDVLDHETESYNKTRESFEIDYELLKSGHRDETRFVLGKIIMDTINERAINPTLKEEVIIDDMINSSEKAINPTFRERKVDQEKGRVKHRNVYKNASKKINEERESHSLNSKDDFKKRDNKRKESCQTLPKKTIVKEAKSAANENGSEMNNESSKKSNTNNTKTGTLPSLFK
ncbi:hypothetical protein LUZ60_014541 [Juncus effusus]|nr:hypothetical protein LUZ60_014541 [Juncus effusus]